MINSKGQYIGEQFGGRIYRPLGCFHPFTIRNKRYANYSRYELKTLADRLFNGGNVIKGFPDDYYLTVPCGKCSLCLKRKRRSMAFRFISEFSSYKDHPKGSMPPAPFEKVCFFITLTFENKYLDNPQFNPREAVSRYLDLLRKRYGLKDRIRHIIIGEFGTKSTERLHYHGVLIGLPYKQLSFVDICRLWKYGRMDISLVRSSIKCGKYISKYLWKYANDKDKRLTRMFVSRGFGKYLVEKDSTHMNSIVQFSPCFSYLHNMYPVHRYYRVKYVPEKNRRAHYVDYLNSNDCLYTLPITVGDYTFYDYKSYVQFIKSNIYG